MSKHNSLYDSDAKKRDQDEITADIARTAAALSVNESVQRFGSGNAEYLKGYRGIDNETGQRFAKGLADIAKHKVNDDPLYASQNIKQQAGFSAEVASTSRDNAEAIIQKSSVRTSRTDDLPQYGKNHNVVDRVQLLDGKIIEGSQAQMKFVGNRDKLLNDIAREDGKFARYQGTKIELPSEQIEGSKEYCIEQANKRRANASSAEAKGNSGAAAKLRREAENFDQLADNVIDSGLSTDDALFYRNNPELATALDIGRTSHRAGLEGVKYGAAIGGSISILLNALSVAQGEKDITEAVKDVSLDTLIASSLGYATGCAGSVLKGGMQQSGSQFVRQLATTSAPALAINVCLSLGSSVKRFVSGDITEAQLLTEVGEKGSGMLSSGMMAAVGQLAIPIPFVGAAIGGMIGYTLSSMFYKCALDAALGAELSREQLERVRAIETAARDRVSIEQAQLDEFVNREIPQLQSETHKLLSLVSEIEKSDMNTLAASINSYATLLGENLKFKTISEFDEFMISNDTLII